MIPHSGITPWDYSGGKPGDNKTFCILKFWPKLSWKSYGGADGEVKLRRIDPRLLLLIGMFDVLVRELIKFVVVHFLRGPGRMPVS